MGIHNKVINSKMKNCVTGKPCGKTCIPISKTCTKGCTSDGPVCVKGKPCGNTCINSNYRCSKCGGSATTGWYIPPIVTPDGSQYTYETVSSYDEFTMSSGSGCSRPVPEVCVPPAPTPYVPAPTPCGCVM